MISKQQNKFSSGRPKGYKMLTPPILWDRWELLFYTTVKNNKGRVIGRDYSKAQEYITDVENKRKRALSCDELIFMQASKSAKYKEDIFKKRPDLIAYEENYQFNGQQLIKPDRAQSLLRLEKEFMSVYQVLKEEGLTSTADGVLKLWQKLEEFPQPTKIRSQAQSRFQQLSKFKLD